MSMREVRCVISTAIDMKEPEMKHRERNRDNSAVELCDCGAVCDEACYRTSANRLMARREAWVRVIGGAGR